MALYFEIRLSQPQIEMLQFFREWTDGPQDEPWVSPFSHFTVHVRALMAEGLISHTEMAKPNKLTGQSTTHVWSITKRGRLVMELVSDELIALNAGRSERKRNIGDRHVLALQGKKQKLSAREKRRLRMESAAALPKEKQP